MFQTFAFVLVAALLSHLFGPWWVFAPVCAAAGILFPVGVISSFLGGMLAMLVLWGAALAQAAYAVPTGLPGRVAQLLGLGSPLTLGAILAVLAGILGGLSALGGGALRNYLFPSRPEKA